MEAWESGIIRIKDNFYAYIDPVGGWFKSNMGIIDGGEYTVLVDTQYNASRLRKILASIKEMGLPPVKLVVNTHHHGDHVWANYILNESIKLSHVVTAKLIKENLDIEPSMFNAFFPDLDFKESKYTMPDISFEGGAAEIFLPNNVYLKLIHVGPAHTPGDTIVVAEEEGIVYCGDVVFYKVTPFALDGYLEGWIKLAENALLNMDAEYFVPGHGPITGKDGILEMVEYLKMVKEISKEGFNKGLTPLELSFSTDLGRFIEWKEPERLVANIYRAYLELKGGVPAEPIKDIATIALDMMALRNKLEEEGLHS